MVPKTIPETARHLKCCLKYWALGPFPKDPKVGNYRVFRVSTLGIVIMVLGTYLTVGKAPLSSEPSRRNEVLPVKYRGLFEEPF